jgi:hypothetical protein
MVAIAAALACCSQSFAAEGPFEPNESLASAYGPLALNQTYSATVESATDRDFYYFYVTAPGESYVSLTIASRGGPSRIAGVNATLLDASETPLDALEYVGGAEARTISVALKPQKYFVEVSPSEGAGDSYDLTVGGAAGAVAPYSAIVARCADSESRVSSAERALSRAEGKKQRATARLQRSRYSGQSVQRHARALSRQAKSLVRSRKLALKSAQRSREPWCSIAQ